MRKSAFGLNSKATHSLHIFCEIPGKVQTTARVTTAVVHPHLILDLPVSNPGWRPATVTKAFRCVPQALKRNAAVVS